MQCPLYLVELHLHGRGFIVGTLRPAEDNEGFAVAWIREEISNAEVNKVRRNTTL